MPHGEAGMGSRSRISTGTMRTGGVGRRREHRGGPGRSLLGLAEEHGLELLHERDEQRRLAGSAPSVNEDDLIVPILSSMAGRKDRGCSSRPRLPVGSGQVIEQVMDRKLRRDPLVLCEHLERTLASRRACFSSRLGDRLLTSKDGSSCRARIRRISPEPAGPCRDPSFARWEFARDGACRALRAGRALVFRPCSLRRKLRRRGGARARLRVIGPMLGRPDEPPSPRPPHLGSPPLRRALSPELHTPIDGVAPRGIRCSGRSSATARSIWCAMTGDVASSRAEEPRVRERLAVLPPAPRPGWSSPGPCSSSSPATT